jgi:hypothetical protein
MRLFVILLIVAAVWVGMKIYNEGTDEAFGGIFAPLESVRGNEDGSTAADLTPAAQEADVPSEPRTARRSGSVPITEGVRDKVTRDMQMGARRRGN